MTATTHTPTNLDAVAPPSGRTTGGVVGGADALTTSDGAVSYAEVTQSGFIDDPSTAHTFTLTPSIAALPFDATVTVDADWSSDLADGGLWLIARLAGGGQVTVANFHTDGAPRGFGAPQTVTVPSWVVRTFPGLLAAGTVWEMTCTRLSSSTEGEPPLTVRATRVAVQVSIPAAPGSVCLLGQPKAVLLPNENGGDYVTVEDAPYGPPATWHGPSPWFRSDDGLVSYAQGSTPSTKVGWLLNPIAGLSGDLTVAVSASYPNGSATSVGIYLHDIATLTGGGDLVLDALDRGNIFNPTGTWAVTSRAFEITPEIAASAAAGRLLVVALTGVQMRLSYLCISGQGGPDPLRIYQRGDGLGAGPSRVYATGTHQTSTRVYGAR